MNKMRVMTFLWQYLNEFQFYFSLPSWKSPFDKRQYVRNGHHFLLTYMFLIKKKAIVRRQQLLAVNQTHRVEMLEISRFSNNSG